MNFEQEDKIVSSFLQSLGPWAPCIIIGGGYALIIYKIYFSDISKGNPPTGTRDIDSLIPRKIPTMSRENISTFLLNAGFNLKGLFEKHPKWAVKFKNHLLDWIKMATPFDWSQLESQDNYGGLNKLHFKSLVENICSD